MANYNLQISWSAKDNLADSDPNKVISGADFETEFQAVQSAVNTKADAGGSSGQDFAVNNLTANGTISGTLATDIVKTVNIEDDAVTSDKIATDAVDATALNVSGNGTAGQALISDGDGSFSWGTAGSLGISFYSDGTVDNASSGVSVSRLAAGQYRITHGLGHTDYVPIVGNNQPIFPTGSLQIQTNGGLYNRGMSYTYTISSQTSTTFDLDIYYRTIYQSGDDNVVCFTAAALSDMNEYIYITIVETT